MTWNATRLCSIILPERDSIFLNIGVNPNFQDEDGWTALNHASYNGHLDVVCILCVILLENKADVNLQNKRGWTALTYASISEHLDIVKILK